MKKVSLSWMVFVLFVSFAAHSQDGIPDNCESVDNPIFPTNVFARYEPASGRLALVDWNSGNDIFQIASDLDDTLIRGWSSNCHYLAVAIGNEQNRDTVVFDTQTGIEVGRVRDAQIRPHTITWGPDDFLIVETRSVAVLWDIRQNIQYRLDVGFNTTSHRNFSRIRWDSENKQVLFNLAVGGRVAYDLTTGQETVIAQSRPGVLTLGGESFVCSRVRQQPLGATVPDLDIFFANDGNVLYIGSRYSNEYRYSTSRESIHTLEAGTSYVDVIPLGWSANCRYVAAALNPDDGIENVYSTVIWDVIENRRVGELPDANGIPHSLMWDTAENHVLMQTRNGALLWNLQTNERILVNGDVRQQSDYCSSYSDLCTVSPPLSFHTVYWDAGRQQLLAVPIQSPDTIVAYDVNTATEVERFQTDGGTDNNPVEFITSDDSRIMVSLANRTLTVINREQNNTSQSFSVPVSTLEGRAAISLDNRYLAMLVNSQLYVWDMITGITDPTFIHNVANFHPNGGVGFVNEEVLVNGSRKYPSRVNVVTGQVTSSQQSISYTPVSGTSGFSSNWYHRLDDSSCNNVAIYNQNTNQIIVAAVEVAADMIDSTTTFELPLSTDCRTAYATVDTLNINLDYEQIPERFSREIIMWDATTGEEIGSFGIGATGERGTYGRIWWNPDGNRALIGALDGFYLFHPETRTIIEIEQPRLSGRHVSFSPSSVYWDHARGLVLMSYLRQVTAFDMITGSDQLTLSPVNRFRNPYFEFSEDGQWIYIYGRLRLGVWNLDSLIHYELSINSGGQRGVTISPDGRYLAVARSVLRVFDLQGDTSTPIFTPDLGARDIESLRFIDSTTIEVIANGIERRDIIIVDTLAKTMEVVNE